MDRHRPITRRAALVAAALLVAGCTPGTTTAPTVTSGPTAPTPTASAASTTGEPILRFVIGSDAHWGMKGTEYEALLTSFVTTVNTLNEAQPIDFVILNGDIGNEKTKHLREAKAVLDGLDVTFHVTQGNNDFATAKQWREIWGVERNVVLETPAGVFLLATTSDGEGSQDCPDAGFIADALRAHQDQPAYLVFHVPPIDKDTLQPRCADLQQLVEENASVKAIFNGHVHDLDQAFVVAGVPVIFDGHIGSKTGVDYFGFRVVEVAADGTITTWMTDGARQLNHQVLPPRP